MRIRRLVFVVVATAALSVSVPAVASAEPVTIGQLAPGSPPGDECVGGNIDSLQPTVISGNSYVVPAAGVVTSWSTNASADSGQTLTMKIYRQISGNEYQVVGHEGPHTLTPSEVNMFSAHIPVQRGDVLGDDRGPTSSACVFSSPGDSFLFNSGDLNDGMSATFAPISGFRVNVAATVQFPPDITSISPTSGSIAGGTSVTITGHDFTGASSVSFGNVVAATFPGNSDSQIIAVSPPASTPGPVDVRVTTPIGTTPIVATDKFTYGIAHCIVPKLKGKTLAKARKLLAAAHCSLAKVKKPKHHKGKLVVKSQSPAAGTVLPNGASVSVKFGPKPKRHHH